MEKKKHIIASEKQTLATLIQEATDNAKMEFFTNPSTERAGQFLNIFSYQ